MYTLYKCTINSDKVLSTLCEGISLVPWWCTVHETPRTGTVCCQKGTLSQLGSFSAYGERAPKRSRRILLHHAVVCQRGVELRSNQRPSDGLRHWRATGAVKTTGRRKRWHSYYVMDYAGQATPIIMRSNIDSMVTSSGCLDGYLFSILHV